MPRSVPVHKSTDIKEATERGSGARPHWGSSERKLDWIALSKDKSRFARGKSEKPFVVWGVNYDHDRAGRLIEDYWHEEWETVEEDFREMKMLGANLVRIHLQTGKFVNGDLKPNPTELMQLSRLLKLADATGLYLNITGLGCYHKKDVPAWYDRMSESERWEVQAVFWEAVARTCARSSAVFCFDLMNEPVLPGEKGETEWLTGELGGKHFVQRITLDLAGRTKEQVAKAWVDKLVARIRKHDTRHLVTVGVIPWAHYFPNAKPLFYSREGSEHLDFVSVHFYPEAGKVDKALKALAQYDIGKPLVIEEMFPMKCSAAEMDAFIDGSRKITEGWVSFYWGKTIEEYAAKSESIGEAITMKWLEQFRAKGRTIAPPTQ